MPVDYATVMNFSDQSGWGFAQTEGTGVKVFVHRNQKCGAILTGSMRRNVRFCPSDPVSPKVGDELVVDIIQTDRGRKAVAWTFRSEWDALRPGEGVQHPAKAVEVPPEPVAVAPPPETEPPLPKVDPPLAFEEMLETLDFRFLHALLDAMEKGELTLPQLQDFVRHPPKGKRGAALWEEFHKRKSNSRDKKYGIAAFIEQVLVDAGFRIEG